MYTLVDCDGNHIAVFARNPHHVAACNINAGVIYQATAAICLGSLRDEATRHTTSHIISDVSLSHVLIHIQSLTALDKS